MTASPCLPSPWFLSPQFWGWGWQPPTRLAWKQDRRFIWHALCKWHVWSNSIRATGIALVYSEWTLNHVSVLFIFKLLLQTSSTASCLLTELRLVFRWISRARSSWSAPSLCWCKSGGVPSSVACMPRSMRVGFALAPRSSVNSTRLGPQTVPQQPLLLASKLVQEICYLYLHRCFKGTWARILPLILKVASGIRVQSINHAVEAALWF